MEYSIIWKVTSYELITDTDKLCESRNYDLFFKSKEAAIKCCTEFPRNDEFIQLTRMETDEYDCYLPMEHEILHVGSLWMRDINLKIERGCSLTLMEKKMMNWYNQNVTK